MKPTQNMTEVLTLYRQMYATAPLKDDFFPTKTDVLLHLVEIMAYEIESLKNQVASIQKDHIFERFGK